MGDSTLRKLEISDASGGPKTLPTVRAMFNPTEMTVTAGANYA